MIILFLADNHERYNPASPNQSSFLKCVSCCGREAQLLFDLHTMIKIVDPSQKNHLTALYHNVKGLFKEFNLDPQKPRCGFGNP